VLSSDGVEQLRDGNLETYWQSDGPQPHLVNIQFHKKTRVQEIEIYTVRPRPGAVKRPWNFPK
jgi:hypothetical protein